MLKVEDKTETAGPPADEIAAQAQRILASPPLQSSDSARRLLSFLAEQSTAHPGKKTKETELAVALYNRSTSSFDPQVDSVARVQVGRLRAKLLEYYSKFGAGDSVVLEIPKGQYCLLGHYRQDEPASSERTVVTSTRRAALLIGAGALAGSLATFFVERGASRASAGRLGQFWGRFMVRGQRTIVVFSNPRLYGTLSIQGLHYANSGVADLGAENLSYAGTGDVRSVHTLTALFDRFRQLLEIESGALLSWDQAREANQIFLGRPEQNPALHELPRLQEFYFRYQMGIVNAHPAANEQPFYGCSQRPYTWDHAVVALIPGIEPPYSTLVLGGSTTYGSQAAVEFMSHEATLSELLERLNVKWGQKVPYFEALLKVHISHDIVIRSEILAVRPHDTRGRSWEPAAQEER